MMELGASSFNEQMQLSIEHQRGKLLKIAREILPYVTPEDIMQPNDYPDLEENPRFRYEEGVLQGMLSILVIYQRERQEQLSCK